MRFANIITALSALAVSGVLSSPVDQANNARIGTATEGNVTATVEMVKTDDGVDVARITYTTVDVEHPEKFSAPVTRICRNIFREYLAFNVLLEEAMNPLYRKPVVLTAHRSMHRRTRPDPGLLCYGSCFLRTQYVQILNSISYTPSRRSQVIC